MKKNIRRFLCKWIGKTSSALKDNVLKGHVFPQSMPIMWFGDFEKYEKSFVRVVTVGLNPSYKEFFERRFDGRVIKSFCKSNVNIAQDYYETLNGYFKFCPYKKWFANFEKVLQMLGSSYGGKMNGGQKFESCALHVDLYSPFATYPTWGNLCDDMQKRFRGETKGLFAELILLLKPNLIILSCGKQVVSSEFSVLKKINAPGALSKSVCGFKWIPKLKCNAINVICGRNMRGTPFGGFAIGNGKEIKKLVKRMEKVK